MIQNIVYFGICSVDTGKECVFCSCWVECSTKADSTLSVMIFCLVVLSIVTQRVLKSAVILVELSISPFSFYQFLLYIFYSCVVCTFTLRIAMFCWLIDLNIV